MRCYAPWYKSVIQLSFGLYTIHNLGVPAALGCVYPVETSTSLYNLYLYPTASTQYFRPFIRVKKHDLLLSTSHHILWNQPTEDGPGVEYVGAVFLLLLLQAATCADPVYPRMVTHVLEKYISNTGISKLLMHLHKFFKVYFLRLFNLGQLFRFRGS